ncbi:hypothetical protein T484DRAFT_1798831 [Baffinella frigidus]|nr:hypothetical protein T484DRAFT_1798831 [Cryptophyta sp. CCMP2293]
MMRPATSGTSNPAARYRPASAKALPGAHKPAPPGQYSIDEILRATARGEDLATRRRPQTAMSRLATAPRTAQTAGSKSASARRALGAIPPVYASSRKEEPTNFFEENFDDSVHYQPSRETFHTDASGQGFDVQRLQLRTPPRAHLFSHNSSPGDSPEGTHLSAAHIAHHNTCYADTPPTVPRLNVGAAIKDAERSGDAWRRGVPHRLFASPRDEEAKASGVSRRAGTACTTGPEAWPDQREQKEAARKKLDQRRMLDEQLASSRHASARRAPPDAHSATTSARLPTAVEAREEEVREKEMEGEARREGQERYRAELDRQVWQKSAEKQVLQTLAERGESREGAGRPFSASAARNLTGAPSTGGRGGTGERSVKRMHWGEREVECRLEEESRRDEYRAIACGGGEPARRGAG